MQLVVVMVFSIISKTNGPLLFPLFIKVFFQLESEEEHI